MASIISAGTTSGTALNMSGDTSGVLQLATNGTTTAMTIDTSQRVAFVAGTAALPAITTTGDTNTGIWFPAADTIAFAEGGAESMRIDSSGNLRIGQTSGNADARTSINGGSTDSSPCIDYVKNSATTSTAQVYARFTAGSTGTGSITANGAAAAAFTAWSDSRLKENITDLPSQLANIMALRPVEFDYVESMGGGHQIGFIAQDVRAIYPDLVGESSDGMLTLTDMNKNDARLIKAIQELKAINDTQAATITALTARIVALETV